MGRAPSAQTTLDLFSLDATRGASVPSKPPADQPPQRHILPKNLRHAIKQLSDDEFEELFRVACDEAKRRGKLPRSIEPDPMPSSRRSTTKPSSADRSAHQPKVNAAEVALTRNQVNMVRAAFKAGVTPSRIARQFGISQSNVRNALASDLPK